MYLGKIVETGTGEDIYRKPLHPYTKSLISAIPVPDPHRVFERPVLSGDVPSPIDPPSGCTFHPRCPSVMDRCKHEPPELRLIASTRQVSCHLDLDD